jgi:uncharacterized protein YceK
MRRRWLVAVVLALALAGGGCATALNLQDEVQRKPYGGFTMPIADFFGSGDFGEVGGILFWPLWLVDKPLSLFGDTITLPYTLWVRRGAASPQTQPSTPSEQKPANP